MDYLYFEEDQEEDQLKINYFPEEKSNINSLESLITFSKSENNHKLKEMIIDLIKYNKIIMKLGNLTDRKNQPVNFKYSLYQNLQKNIIEIIYIKDKEKKEEMINKIYAWYIDKLKLYEELKYMKIKSYISPEEFDDEKYVNKKYKDMFEERKKFISQTDKTKNEMRHRSIETYNKITIESLNNYKTKHILKIKKVKKSITKIGLEKKSESYYMGNKNVLNLKHENKNNDINLPFLNYSLLKANKEIIEAKNKLIAEKRNQEEAEKKINEFSMNKSKYKSNLVNKYEIKELINKYVKKNNFNSFILKKYQNNEFEFKSKKKNEEEKNKGDFSLIRRKSSIKESDIININDFEELENDSIEYDFNEEQPKSIRKITKYKTERIHKIPKKLFKEKILLNDIHNLNIKTNKIIDQENEKIIYNDITLKYPKNKINNQIFSKCLNNNKKIPTDSVAKLTFHNDIFRQRLLYKKLLSIRDKKERFSNSNINNFSQKNIFGDDYNFIKKNKFKLNFNLSAYDLNNIEKIKKNSNFINCSERKNNNKIRIYKINNSYNIYKDNYLDLRKSLSNYKKNEYIELLNLTKREQEDENLDEENKSDNLNNKEKLKNESNLEGKKLFKNKINAIKERKQISLSNAILNPNESNTFSKYYLPRSGSLLLSRYK